MANLINIGITGLIAHQSALSTTGNNITNANVPGYSRQRVELGTLNEQLLGPGYVGAGSKVVGIERIVEQFLVSQLRLDTANYNEINALTKQFEQLDGLLANSSTSVSTMMQKFFASLEQSGLAPTSVAERQVVLNDAGSLVQRFQSLYQQLQAQSKVIDQQLGAMVGQVNSLASSIAALNEDIAKQTTATGGQPNALLDQRDEQIRKLAELVGVTAVPDASGQVNVFIGNGQPLVVGGRANSVATAPSTEDPTQLDIVFDTGSSRQPIGQFLSGGKIGGLLDYRADGLAPAMNEIGRMAIVISDAFNQQQRLGLDLDGNPGQNIFTDINTASAMSARALGSSTNAGTGQLSVYIDDASALTGKDYRLVFTSATDYQLLDGNGRALTPPLTGTIAGVPATITTPDGFEIRIDSGAPAIGDSYRIQPTRQGASDVGLALTDPRGLALAQPIRTSASSANTGTGAISAGSMIAFYQADGVTPQSTFAAANALSPPVLVRFTSATGYEILDNSNPAAPAAFVPPVTGTITPGQANTITVNDPVSGDPVYSFDISGYPAAGDSFAVAYNLNGSSDNRNAVAMNALRLADTVGGEMTLEETYSKLVAGVGSRTASLRINSEASLSLLNQAQANRDEVSAVNLDEEAANLIRFEQAYNASAQVISIARSLFDSLLASMR